MKVRDFSLRIDDDLLRKLHYIADCEDRSVNRELLRLIRKHITEFELINGEIILQDETEQTKNERGK